jgi:CysZ protein
MLFPDIRRELLQRRALSLGFGTGILFLTMIPVVNFVAMPVGVAGATRLYVERFRPANTV